MSVNAVDAENFNNPDVWPVGVCVRRWRNFYKQTELWIMKNYVLLHITVKHFYDSGDKFDFINKLMCDSEF